MIKNYKNEPIKCDEALYDEAIKQYASIVSEYKEVKSIIQIGNVGVAGISDIDLIVYLDENMICDNNYSLYQIDKKFHHVLMHDVFVIPLKYINQSYLVTSIFDTKVIYGKDISCNNSLNEEEDVTEKMILLNDQAVVSLLYEYEFWDAINIKNVKLIIARLNSIKYPIMLLNTISTYFKLELSQATTYEKFVNDFSLFRKEWFSNTIDENLIRLDFFIKTAKNTIAPSILNDILLINQKIKYFTLESNLSSFKLNKNVLIKGYSNFFINLYIYINGKGDISSHLMKKLKPLNNIKYCNELYLQIATKRINMINDIYSFRKKNKIYYGDLWTFGKTNIPFILKVFSKLKRIMTKLLFLKSIK